MKQILKVKSDTTVMRFPNMGDIKDLVLVCHGDAGMKSMPDKNLVLQAMYYKLHVLKTT